MKLKNYIKESSGIQVYDNPSGETARVNGLYVEIDNKYDKRFKTEKELNKWLKKEKFKWVGTD